MTETEILQLLLRSIAIGMLFFAGCIFIMVLLFGTATAEFKKNSKQLLVLFFLTMSLPIATTFLNNPATLESFADTETKIINFEVVESDDAYFISYETTVPAVSYVESKNSNDRSEVFLPTYSLSKRTDHSLYIPKSEIDLQDASVIVNTKRFSIKSFID